MGTCSLRMVAPPRPIIAPMPAAEAGNTTRWDDSFATSAVKASFAAATPSPDAPVTLIRSFFRSTSSLAPVAYRGQSHRNKGTERGKGDGTPHLLQLDNVRALRAHNDGNHPLLDRHLRISVSRGGDEGGQQRLCRSHLTTGATQGYIATVRVAGNLCACCGGELCKGQSGDIDHCKTQVTRTG